jgi:hypothetical protein
MEIAIIALGACMKHGTFFRGAGLFSILVSGAVMGMAEDTFTPPTPVGPVTASILQLNYSDLGGTVNGFLIGSNVLLTFLKPVCGGIGTLGTVGNSVTYSGSAFTSKSGFQTVNVTSFTNGTIKYPPVATPSKPTAYSSTPGTIVQLNYEAESGDVNGFVFKPTSGPTVLVDIGFANATLTPLLKVGAAVTVVGTLEATPQCAPPVGTIPEVYASSLTIAGMAYPVGSFLQHLLPFLP